MAVQYLMPKLALNVARPVILHQTVQYLMPKLALNVARLAILDVSFNFVRDLCALRKGVISKTDYQAVESVDLVRQQESSDAVRAEEQILRILGEIRDDE